MKLLFSLLLTFLSTLALSYPENIRHGYVNCTTCHVSPNGGGLLTPYGRSLSREVVSTWGSENETKWMYFVTPPEWLNLGGNVRWIQTHKDTPTYKQDRFILMQADIEAQASYDKFSFVGTLGRSQFNDPKTAGEFLVSRRHYLMYKPTDEITVRGGRFLQAFGLVVPDHTVVTRRTLGFDQDQETYNIEGSYVGEKYDLFVTANMGRIDQPSYKRERGVSLRGSMQCNEKYKFGAGYYFGHNETQDRHLFGPYGIAAIVKPLVVMQETDFVHTNLGSGTLSAWGIAHMAKLDYEVFQGVHFFVMEDFYRGNFKDGNTVSNSFGGGIQFFPRPHFELIAQYQRLKIVAVDPNNYNDYLWFQMHFYP